MKLNIAFRIRIILTILFLTIFNTVAISQDQNSSFWSQVRIGGGIGLSFGNGFFSGTLAPSAIYDFNEKISMGLGLNGTYNTQKNFYKSSIIGGSVLGLYNVIPQLQISGEFEELYVTRNYDSSIGFPDDKYTYPALFLGVGFRQNHFTIGLRYDVLYDADKSIYASGFAPFVRVYF